MSVISWGPGEPTTASTASSGDDAIRSFLTACAVGLGEMMYFPGSAALPGASTASSGEARLGTMRVAKTSTVSGGYNDGYLALETTRLGLHHIGTNKVGLYGHPGMLEATGTGLTAPFTARAMLQSGSYTTASASGVTTLSFSSVYGGQPLVFVTASSSELIVGGLVTSASAFQSRHSFFDGATPASVTIYWLSYGTAAF